MNSKTAGARRGLVTKPRLNSVRFFAKRYIVFHHTFHRHVTERERLVVDYEYFLFFSEIAKRAKHATACEKAGGLQQGDARRVGGNFRARACFARLTIPKKIWNYS